MAAWFDSKDWIKRYSPFGVMQNMQGVNQMNALMSPSGHITDLGNWVSLRISSCKVGRADWTFSTSGTHSEPAIPKEGLCGIMEKNGVSFCERSKVHVSVSTLRKVGVLSDTAGKPEKRDLWGDSDGS